MQVKRALVQVCKPEIHRTCALLLKHDGLRRGDATTTREAVVERHFDGIGNRSNMFLLRPNENMGVLWKWLLLQALERDHAALGLGDVVVVTPQLHRRRHRII